MIAYGRLLCPRCGGELIYYDCVKRYLRGKYGRRRRVILRRMRCDVCHSIHRELPDYILPFKQYDADIITGVLEGLITFETTGFEDYPSECTVKRWRKFPPTLL